jgi:hypothetical protein
MGAAPGGVAQPLRERVRRVGRQGAHVALAACVALGATLLINVLRSGSQQLAVQRGCCSIFSLRRRVRMASVYPFGCSRPSKISSQAA